MRIAYFDCGSGASGDMILGALVDAGADLALLNQQLDGLIPGEVQLIAARATRAGFACTKVDVVCRRKDPHGRLGGHDPDPGHGRHLRDILALIDGGSLPRPVKRDAAQVFQRLTAAEAKVHDCAQEDVHFHEVGAVDSIADIVGGVAALHQLGVERVYTSALALGTGYVDCAHGRLPVPVPATLELTQGYRVVRTDVEGELLTPTGAAMLTTLATSEPAPVYKVVRTGVGAGGRELRPWPNVLRVSLGETAADLQVDSVWVLEANIDDMTPEHCGYVTERLMAAGALDVYTTSIQMKKGRPGILLSVIAEEAAWPNLERIMFTETTTFGIRRQRAGRTKLPREIVGVETPYGSIRVKVGKHNGAVCTVAPEYEDCRAAAASQGVPLRDVYRAACRAYEAL